MRLRHRPTAFMHRGNSLSFHRLQDGPTLGRLDPYAAGEQVWLLHSGRTIAVTAAEVRDISKQVHGLDLPETRPDGGSCNCGARMDDFERRLAALEAQPAPTLNEALDESLEENPELFGGGVLGPLEALKAKIDAVRNGGSAPSGVDDLPALTPADLLNMVEDNPPGSAAELENAVRALRGEGRRRFAELLNEELSALEQLRKVGKAGADPRREHDIQYLLGLFARLGET